MAERQGINDFELTVNLFRTVFDTSGFVETDEGLTPHRADLGYKTKLFVKCPFEAIDQEVNIDLILHYICIMAGCGTYNPCISISI